MMIRGNIQIESIGRVWDMRPRHIEVGKHGHAEEMEVSGLLSLRIPEKFVKGEDSQ